MRRELGMLSQRKDQFDKEVSVAAATAAAAKKAAADATDQLEGIHRALHKAQGDLEGVQKCVAFRFLSLPLRP